MLMSTSSTDQGERDPYGFIKHADDWFLTNAKCQTKAASQAGYSCMVKFPGKKKKINREEIPCLEPFLIGNGQLGTAGACRDTGANSKYIWKTSTPARSRQWQMAPLAFVSIRVWDLCSALFGLKCAGQALVGWFVCWLVGWFVCLLVCSLGGWTRIWR